MEIPMPATTWNRVYLALNTLHVLAVTLFLGSIVMGIFWKLRSDRTADPRIIAYTLEGMVRAYRWLTLPSAVLVALFGFAMVYVGDVRLGFSWIILGVAMLTVSVAALVGGVAPVQRRMLALLRSAGGGATFDRAAYERLTDRWRIWVLVATTPPVVAVFLMVFKPL